MNSNYNKKEFKNDFGKNFLANPNLLKSWNNLGSSSKNKLAKSSNLTNKESLFRNINKKKKKDKEEEIGKIFNLLNKHNVTIIVFWSSILIILQANIQIYFT